MAIMPITGTDHFLRDEETGTLYNPLHVIKISFNQEAPRAWRYTLHFPGSSVTSKVIFQEQEQAQRAVISDLGIAITVPLR